LAAPRLITTVSDGLESLVNLLKEVTAFGPNG